MCSPLSRRAFPEAELLHLWALVPGAWLIESRLSFCCDAKVISLLEKSGPSEKMDFWTTLTQYSYVNLVYILLTITSRKKK